MPRKPAPQGAGPPKPDALALAGPHASPLPLALAPPPAAANHPGQRTFASGSGHAIRLPGEAPAVLGTQYPARGSSVAPPGHSAPAGQRTHVPPPPHPQTKPLGGGGGGAPLTSAHASGGANWGSTHEGVTRKPCRADAAARAADAATSAAGRYRKGPRAAGAPLPPPASPPAGSSGGKAAGRGGGGGAPAPAASAAPAATRPSRSAAPGSPPGPTTSAT